MIIVGNKNVMKSKEIIGIPSAQGPRMTLDNVFKRETIKIPRIETKSNGNNKNISILNVLSLDASSCL